MRPPVQTTPMRSLPSTERLGASGLRSSASPVVSPWAPADMIRSHSLPGPAPSPSPRSGLPTPSCRFPSRRTTGGAAGFDGWRRMAFLALPLVLLALAACTRIGNPEGGSGGRGLRRYPLRRHQGRRADRPGPRLRGEALGVRPGERGEGSRPLRRPRGVRRYGLRGRLRWDPVCPVHRGRGGAWSRRRRTRSASPGTSSGAS